MVFCEGGPACSHARQKGGCGSKSKQPQPLEYPSLVPPEQQDLDDTQLTDEQQGDEQHRIWQETVDEKQIKPIVDFELGPRAAGFSEGGSKTPQDTSPITSKLNDHLNGAKISTEVKKALELLESLSISNAVRAVEVLASKRPVFLRSLRASPLFNGSTPGSPAELDQDNGFTKPKLLLEATSPSEKSNGKEFDAMSDIPSSLEKCPRIPGGTTMRRSILASNAGGGGRESSHSDDKGESEARRTAYKNRQSTVDFNKSNNAFTVQNMGGGGILQFSTPVYYCKVGEEECMIVDVTRLGSAKEECSCYYQTQNASAKAGKRYIAQSGKLVFEGEPDGAIMKQICVPILENKSWNATLEFKIILSDPENCLLGKYLHTARVKIIDDQIFPTDKYRQKILCRDFESITHFGLFREYLRMNFRASKKVRKSTILTLLVDQLQNFHLILRLVILKDLVDKIFLGNCGSGDKVIGIFDCPGEKEEGKNYHQILLNVALLYICPMFFVHMADLMKVYWKIRDKSGEHLQGNLIRKYLNYDDSSRKQLNQSDLNQTIMQDIPNIIDNGLLQTFVLATHLGRLVLMFLLQIYLGAYLEAAPCVGLPVILLGILGIRRRKKERVLKIMVHNQNTVVKWVAWLQDGFRLIADYMKRPEAVEQCEGRIVDCNRSKRNANALLLNNEYVEVWIATILLGAWVFFGGNWILDGGNFGDHQDRLFSLTIGEFLLHLDIFREAGESWRAIHHAKRKIEGALPSLARVVRFMNLPIDLEKRMRLNRRRRQLGEQARKRVRGGRRTLPKGVYAADLVPIQLEGVGYRYENSSWDFDDTVAQGAEHSEGSVQDVTFEFPQGILVAVVGLPGQGKSTLLKILGGVLIPDRGNLLVPPHLRALHISEEPLFFKGTLWDNLTYGVNKKDPCDSDPERVKAICRRLSVQERFCVFLDPKNDSVFNYQADWSELLSMTQRTLLHLARAFVANPEILVLHKPTLFFDDELTANTYSTLREYVECKGLEMDPVMLEHRRPRTCVVTTVRAGGAQMADKVLCVTPTGVLIKDPKEVTYAELL